MSPLTSAAFDPSCSWLLWRTMLPTPGLTSFPSAAPQLSSHLQGLSLCRSSELINSKAVVSFRNLLNTSSDFSPMKDEFTKFRLRPFHDRGFFLKDLEVLRKLACLVNSSSHPVFLSSPQRMGSVSLACLLTFCLMQWCFPASYIHFFSHEKKIPP